MTSLRDRLGRTPVGTIGVIFAVAGFTEGAIGDARSSRAEPVLLFGQPDMEHALASPDELLGLLQRKVTDLAVHGRVHLAESRTWPLESLGMRASERHAYRLIGAARSADPWLTIQGDSTSLVFAQNIPDVDWSWGYDTAAVSLEMAPRLDDEAALTALIERLRRQGWTTGHGRWSIDQLGQSWHCTGAEDAIAAIRDFRGRYQSTTSIHHTEEVTYFDHVDRGFYMLTSQISSTPDRRVFHSRLDITLHGIPLDQTPLRALADAVGDDDPPVLRPRIERRLQRGSLRSASTQPLRLRGYVIADRDDDEPWAVGVIVDNPYRGRPGEADNSPWLGYLRDLDVIVCALRHHHPARDPEPRRYRLESWEFAPAGGAAVLTLVADW